MPEIVIPDTSSLILFHKIGELNLLQAIYKNLITTQEVASEFDADLPGWIEIKKIKDHTYQKFLETQVDSGEASVIALAKESKNPLLILDDPKARKLAQRLNLRITGTLGVIHKARRIGTIDKVQPVLDKLLSTDFRISQRLIRELLRLNDELNE
jgi:predicted nucleic acid-binding protein